MCRRVEPCFPVEHPHDLSVLQAHVDLKEGGRGLGERVDGGWKREGWVKGEG